MTKGSQRYNSHQEILAILLKHEIRTVGDLDHYADVRGLSRWHALAQLVGQDGADLVLGLLALRMAQQGAERRATR